MFSKQIPSDYLNRFRSLLTGLNTVIELDWVTLEEKFQTATWPGRHKSAVMLAVPVPVRNKCLPFQPAISLTSVPNHVSKKSAILEFKVIDGSQSSLTTEGTQYFPISLSLFESGRQVLKLYGLTLDTKEQTSQYEDSTLLLDKRVFEHLPLIMKLVDHLIENFPVSENNSVAASCRDRALADLRQTVRYGAKG